MLKQSEIDLTFFVAEPEFFEYLFGHGVENRRRTNCCQQYINSVYIFIYQYILSLYVFIVWTILSVKVTM